INGAERGGERERVDSKDCWFHITFQNNAMYLTDASGSAANTGASLCFQSNSAALVQNNFCHDTESDVIEFVNTYAEYSGGYFDGAVVRNNIIANTGIGANYGY